MTKLGIEGTNGQRYTLTITGTKEQITPSQIHKRLTGELSGHHRFLAILNSISWKK
jgi:hypothetical protein